GTPRRGTSMRTPTIRTSCTPKRPLLIALVALVAIVGLGGAVSDTIAATGFSGVSGGPGVNAIGSAALVHRTADDGFSLDTLRNPASRGLPASVPLLSLELSHSPASVLVGHQLPLTRKLIDGPHPPDHAL